MLTSDFLDLEKIQIRKSHIIAVVRMDTNVHEGQGFYYDIVVRALKHEEPLIFSVFSTTTGLGIPEPCYMISDEAIARLRDFVTDPHDPPHPGVAATLVEVRKLILSIVDVEHEVERLDKNACAKLLANVTNILGRTGVGVV